MAMTGSSYRFNSAIVRTPGDSVSAGLREGSGVDPDAAAFKIEHRGYVAALADAGVAITQLDELWEFPDSVFVEDAALCLAGHGIVLRPGTPTRAGESAAIRNDLEVAGLTIIDLPGPGTIEGGDILVTDEEVFVGRSQRTDAAGIEALQQAVEPLGYTVREVVTPPNILHFKTDCGLLDSTMIFSTERLAAVGCFAGYDVLVAPAGEEAAANLIRVNDTVLVAAGFPKTTEMLRGFGYNVSEVAAYEAAKIDGGLSCMSLRFSI